MLQQDDAPAPSGSVTDVSSAVVGDPQAARPPAVVRLRAGDRDEVPVFMCPDMTGDVLTTIRLSRLLPGRRPVWGLRFRTRPDGSAVDLTVADMAESIVERIRQMQPEGDYTLMGYSFGANLAFEAARLLEQAGQRVSVAMIDPYVSDHCLSPAARRRFRYLARPWSILRWLAGAGWPERRNFAHRVVHRLAPWTGVGPPPPIDHAPTTEQEERMAAVSNAAFVDYRPGALHSPVLVVAATERFPDLCDPLPILLAETEPAHTEVVWGHGSHQDLVVEPGVHHTADVLGGWLTQSIP